MASPLDSFISTYLAMDQRNRQLRRERMEEAGVKAQQYTTVAALLQNVTDPEQQSGLLDQLSGMGLGDRDTLGQLAKSVTPNLETQRAATARAGTAAMSPEDTEAFNAQAASRGILGMDTGQARQADVVAQALSGDINPAWQNDFTRRLLTGMSEGQYASDQGIAALNPDQHRTVAAMQGGLQMTVPQQANLALGYQGDATQRRGQNLNYNLGNAQLRQSDRALMQQGALAELDMISQRGAATAKMMQANDSDALGLLESSRKILADIHTGNMSAPAIQEAYRIINTNYSMLRARGYNDFQPIHIGAATENTRQPNSLSKIFGVSPNHSPNSWRP